MLLGLGMDIDWVSFGTGAKSIPPRWYQFLNGNQIIEIPKWKSNEGL